MESSVLIAIVTAITSIIVALIQGTTSLRVTRLKEPLVQPNAVSVEPSGLSHLKI
jgi:helix-turn-helix protein